MMTVQSGMSPLGMMRNMGANTLSAPQKQGLEEVLAQYDAEDLSDDQAKALVKEIQDLGIQPGRGLTETLSTAGIDARGLADQAGIGAVGGPGGGGGGGGRGGPGGSGGPGGAQGAKGPDSAAVQTLQSIVDQLQAARTESDADEDFRTLMLQTLHDAGLDTSEPIVDFRS